MNTLNICAIIFAASISICADNAYSCEGVSKDIYDTCSGDSGLDCYSEDEYPSYRVARVSEGALKVTTNYKGKDYISLWSTKGQGEDVCTAYRRMDSGMARVLAAYGNLGAATLTILERIYSQNEGISFAKVYTDKNHYTLFSCQGGGTLESASYVMSRDWWVTDRLTSCGSTNIADEEAYKLLTAAKMCGLPYKWIQAEVDRALYIAAGHKNYLYRLAQGHIEAV
jgi:hypothetical protein